MTIGNIVFKSNITNILLSLLPVTRLFRAKAIILRYLGFTIGSNVSVTGNIKIYGRGNIIIGNTCWIGIGCKFYVSSNVEVSIGDNCDIAPDVKFVTGSHHLGSSDRRAGECFADNISIGSGCWIGINSVLLPGVHLGSGTVVAAGSVVKTGSYPPNILLAGVPAKMIKSYST